MILLPWTSFSALMSSRPGSRTARNVFKMLRLFSNFLEKNHDGTGGFPESANLQTPFGGFPAFLVIAQKVFKPWFRKKLQMPGAHNLRSGGDS